MTRTRVFDWRFILALTFGAMVSYLVWVGVTAVHDGQDKDERNAELVVLLKTEQKSAKVERSAATAERKVLLDKQDDLLREVSQLQRRQAQLLDYLRENGIAVPSFAGSSSSSRSEGSGTPKGRGKAKGLRTSPGSTRR